MSPRFCPSSVLGGDREALMNHLKKMNIDVGIHFIPVHKHTFYLNVRTGDMSVTERVTQEVMTVPLHSNMKPEFVERVIEGITSFFV